MQLDSSLFLAKLCIPLLVYLSSNVIVSSRKPCFVTPFYKRIVSMKLYGN